MAIFSSYPATSALNDDDFFLIDGTTGGTRIISGTNLASEMSRLAPGIDSITSAESLGIGDDILILKGSKMYKIAFSELVDAVQSQMETV